MTDTEVLEWLVKHGAIDWPVITFRQLAGDDVKQVRRRLARIEIRLEERP